MSCRMLVVAGHAPGRYDRVMLNQRDAEPLMAYRKTAHSVYDLKYHIVWVTKYRKPVLRGEIALRVRELIRQTCQTLDVYILQGHVSVDHVHLLLSVPPHQAVSQVVQRLKGRSSHKLLSEFNELSRQYWGRHMWARGYFAVTTGNVTDEIIRQYIASQSDHPPSDTTDNFDIGE
jgi:putative transposase